MHEKSMCARKVLTRLGYEIDEIRYDPDEVLLHPDKLENPTATKNLINEDGESLVFTVISYYPYEKFLELKDRSSSKLNADAVNQLLNELNDEMENCNNQSDMMMNKAMIH
jgi:hypothetical protein